MVETKALPALSIKLYGRYGGWTLLTLLQNQPCVTWHLESQPGMSWSTTSNDNICYVDPDGGPFIGVGMRLSKIAKGVTPDCDGVIGAITKTDTGSNICLLNDTQILAEKVPDTTEALAPNGPSLPKEEVLHKSPPLPNKQMLQNDQTWRAKAT